MQNFITLFTIGQNGRRDTVGEDGLVTMGVGLREKMREEEFCNTILLHTLQRHTDIEEREREGEGGRERVCTR